MSEIQNPIEFVIDPEKSLSIKHYMCIIWFINNRNYAMLEKSEG